MPLTFKTKAERMQHPQAKLIPDSIWASSRLFANSLDDAVLAMMQASDEDLTSRFDSLPKLTNKPLTSKAPLELRMAAFVGIALSHPNLPFSVFKSLNVQFDFHPRLVVELFTILGYEAHLLEYMNTLSPSEVSYVNYANFYYYKLAAEQGRLSSMKRLETYDELKDRKDADYVEVYLLAASKGQLEAMHHLETYGKLKDTLVPKLYKVYQLAAENGQLEAMRHLEKMGPLNVRADYYNIVYGLAASNGHVSVMQHLETKATTAEQQFEMFEEAYISAAGRGRLEVLLYLENKMQQLDSRS